jgi:hypothetical protein
VATAPEAPPGVRGRALFAAGDIFYARGEWGEYRQLLDEAVRLLRLGGDDEALAYAQWGLSIVNHHLGEIDAAERVALEALARAEEKGYDELVGRINILLGINSLVGGDASAARARFERAAGKFEEMGYSYGRGLALENLATASVLEGDFAGAARALSEGLDAWDLSENLHNLGHLLVVAAAIARAHRDAALAANLLGAVGAVFERLSIPLDQVEATIDRETRKLAEAELGTPQFEAALERGAGRELADELALVKEHLRLWATLSRASG